MSIFQTLEGTSRDAKRSPVRALIQNDDGRELTAELQIKHAIDTLQLNRIVYVSAPASSKARDDDAPPAAAAAASTRDRGDSKRNSVRDGISSLMSAFCAGLPSSTSLQALHVSGVGLGAQQLQQLALALSKVPQLHTLSIEKEDHGNKLAATIGSAFRNHPSLTSLQLNDLSMGPAGLTSLCALFENGGCIPIVFMGLRSNALSDAGAQCATLLQSKTLAELDVSNCAIGDEGAAAIASMLPETTSLRSLNLDWNALSQAGLEALAQGLQHNRSLTRLSFFTNELGDSRELGDLLRNHPSLLDLNLARNGISSGGMKFFCAALDSGKLSSPIALQRLDLSKNKLQNVGAMALFAALAKHTLPLTTLILSDNEIGALQTISAALTTNRSLTALTLDGNPLGSAGAKSLAGGLLQNPAIAYLSLHRCKIGLDGIKALSPSLLNNSSMRHLDLSGNDLRDDGCRAVAMLLSYNALLSSLLLRDNGITDSGATALATTLRTNAGITELRLEKNNIGADGGRALLDVLQHNANLTGLYLHRNAVDFSMVEVLESALAKNCTLVALTLAPRERGAQPHSGNTPLLRGLNRNRTLVECDTSGPEVQKLLLRNQRMQSRILRNWQRVGPYLAAARANRKSALLKSSVQSTFTAQSPFAGGVMPAAAKRNTLGRAGSAAAAAPPVKSITGLGMLADSMTLICDFIGMDVAQVKFRADTFELPLTRFATAKFATATMATPIAMKAKAGSFRAQSEPPKGTAEPSMHMHAASEMPSSSRRSPQEQQQQPVGEATAGAAAERLQRRSRQLEGGSRSCQVSMFGRQCELFSFNFWPFGD